MKRMLALLAACAMLCTLAACGQQEEGSAAGSGNAAPTDSVQDSATDSKPADSTVPGDSSKAEESGSDSRKDPDAPEHSESSGTDSAAQSPEHNGDTPSGPGTENSQPDNPSSGKDPSGEQKPAASTPTQQEQQSPAATTAAQADSTPASDIKTITLLGDSVRFEGKGIAVRGSKVGITKGGTYRISGSLSDGQIEINTEKKVVLQLDGVSIKNSAGSAINVINAKRVNMELMPGTVNSLEDGSVQHDADKGTLFSNDTLEIGGSGTLNIRSNYAHGIASDDDIIVNGGRLHIVSTKSGLFANDDITINGGTLYCDAGTNGIKCKNTISINGGTSVLMGGTREEKGAVIAIGGLTINGGTLYAVGNTCTLPLASSGQNVVAVNFASALSANMLTRIASGSSPLFTLSSPRAYKTVLYSGSGLREGASYTVSTGGMVSGGNTADYVTTGGTYSGGTDRGTYKTTGRVSTFSVS
ncbi:carbohydrate-binding domain-containing protein [Ruminococcus champanellensis]|uniref:carbohydrate-binding domain-containing protein n=1 Tax=Ruminococcus champanellensis TaxID=1161942 RepID=UPI0023F1BFB3|nr:carbohydrate-binding domain-containing protein [Ruminococcus champanellensis]